MSQNIGCHLLFQAFVWDLSFGRFRCGAFVLKFLFGILRLITFAKDFWVWTDRMGRFTLACSLRLFLSFGNVRLGYFDSISSLGDCCEIPFVWDLSFALLWVGLALGNIHLGSLVPCAWYLRCAIVAGYLALGNCRLGTFTFDCWLGSLARDPLL